MICKKQLYITKYSIYYLLVLFLFANCSNKGEGNQESCFSNINAETIFHDGENREYIIYIPSSYDETSNVPLMFNFHGFGGSANDYMNYADMRTLAENEVFILVYPQGSCLDGDSHWNPSLSGADNKSDADDFGFIEGVINKISSDYTIDRERIYACGYSNGGMFAYGLANFKSNLIAAVASVSGTMLDFNGPTSHPMPIMHLHGTSDLVIPYNGDVYYNSAQSVVDYWIDFNNTVTNPTINSESNGGMTIEHYLYDQGDNGVSVEHYKYIEGEHIWFTTLYQGKNTAQLIWDFVSKYDINGLR